MICIIIYEMKINSIKTLFITSIVNEERNWNSLDIKLNQLENDEIIC